METPGRDQCVENLPRPEVALTGLSALRTDRKKSKAYCFGVGVAAAFSGVGVAFGSFRASLRVSRPFLRASTRVRRRVFFYGDALSVTAPFAGLGAGGSLH
jgi:hypothetical protein